MNFKLGLAQVRVQPGDEAGNLERACEAVEQAAAARCQVVLLPEALPFGWTHSLALKKAKSIPAGAHCERLRNAARQHAVYICAGLVERDGAKLFNAAVLVDPQGEVLIHHRKIYELDIAHHLYALGDRLSVARTELGTLGVMICADGFAPGQVISRTLALMGADIILSPCAWAVPADHDNVRDPYGKLWIDNYGPVARDYRIWIAGCSNVGPITDGPWRDRRCIGCSMVVGPDGKTVARAPYGEDASTILYADVTLERRPAQGTQWEEFLSANSQK